MHFVCSLFCMYKRYNWRFCGWCTSLIEMISHTLYKKACIWIEFNNTKKLYILYVCVLLNWIKWQMVAVSLSFILISVIGTIMSNKTLHKDSIELNQSKWEFSQKWELTDYICDCLNIITFKVWTLLFKWFCKKGYSLISVYIGNEEQ
jgi:hypothetical protein